MSESNRQDSLKAYSKNTTYLPGNVVEAVDGHYAVVISRYQPTWDGWNVITFDGSVEAWASERFSRKLANTLNEYEKQGGQ